MEKLSRWTVYQPLIQWVEQIAQLCCPEDIHLCNGSPEEYQTICQLLVDQKTFIPLNQSLRPNSFLCRSNPKDVARVEDQTFICSKREEDAGPTNHWMDPEAMRKNLQRLFKGCMSGRTMYVIPFSMGPIGSPLSIIGVEITDSPYVVAHMHLMTRMGDEPLRILEQEQQFVPCVHSVGVPLKPGEQGKAWPCVPHKTHIVHFPEDREIWSFGSGYGGNALLGKKCLALRIASEQARRENWLAEHMLIIGVTNPQGKKKFFAAAFPSACGKTNLAMLQSSLPGWKVECVGDDIAWMRFGEDGKLYAINPEYGFFGVAPGTSNQSNPNAMQTISKNAIFTNVALTDEGDVWWEGLTDPPPDHLVDWRGENWHPSSDQVAAHPNSRFAARAEQCPVIDPNFNSKKGVEISAILFGGRRESVLPLVVESFSWEHGVFLGASISSEMTAAARGNIGQLRHDPFAMLPFCGYHMGDYFAHWLKMGSLASSNNLPKIFQVNWFRQSSDHHYLWPGFGENMRVLQWVFERCEGKEEIVQYSPLGYLPTEGALNVGGLSLSPSALHDLFSFDYSEWQQEIFYLRHSFKIFGKRLPRQIDRELDLLQQRLREGEERSSKYGT